MITRDPAGLAATNRMPSSLSGAIAFIPLWLAILQQEPHQSLSFEIPASPIYAREVWLRRVAPTSPRCRCHLASSSRRFGSRAVASRPRSSTRILENQLNSVSEKGDADATLNRDTGEEGQRHVMTTAPTTLAVEGESKTVGQGARSINWPLWYVLPIAPYQRRKTIMKEIVPGKVSLQQHSRGVPASTDLADSQRIVATWKHERTTPSVVNSASPLDRRINRGVLPSWSAKQLYTSQECSGRLSR